LNLATPCDWRAWRDAQRAADSRNGPRGAAGGAARTLVRAVAAEYVAVQAPVVDRRSENLLHVDLRLRERDVVDQLGLLARPAIGLPPDDASRPGVVAGQRIRRAAQVVDEPREVARAEPDVGLGIGQHARTKWADAFGARELPPRGGQNLHEPPCIGRRPHVG